MTLLAQLGFARSACDPSLFFVLAFSLILIVHVDDICPAGPRLRVESIVDQIKKLVRIRETARLTKPGDIGEFLGRSLQRTAKGFKLRGSQKIIDQLIVEFGMSKAKPVSTPAVRMSEGQLALYAKPLDEREYRQYS